MARWVIEVRPRLSGWYMMYALGRAASTRSIAAAIALWIGALASGCALLDAADGPPGRGTFVGLEDGAVLGGEQTTIIDADVSSGAVRVDLFLDGERIGVDQFSPFAIEWNTTEHAEGEAELRARVTAADGTTAVGSIEIVIDNAAPVVEPLPASLTPYETVEFRVTDANRIVRVELAGVSPAQTWMDPPYTLVWSQPCGIADVSITAEDEVGWRSTWTGPVDTFLVGDRDCDGYASPEERPDGTDCDGLDPDVHPGQPDKGPDGDVDCDGVAGTDADGDGIAARDRGGSDCDDTDPDVHPAGMRFDPHPLELGGEKDINPGRVAFLPDLTTFYTKGNQVWAASYSAGTWTYDLFLVLDEPAEQPIARVRLSGATRVTAVVVRAGTSIHIARHDGSSWQSQLVETTPVSASGR